MKTQRWMSVREAVLHLADNLQQYASYLDSQREATKVNESRMEVSDDTDEITILAAKNTHPGLAAWHYDLHQSIEKSKHFEAVFVNNHVPHDARKRYVVLL